MHTFFIITVNSTIHVFQIKNEKRTDFENGTIRAFSDFLELFKRFKFNKGTFPTLFVFSWNKKWLDLLKMQVLI